MNKLETRYAMYLEGLRLAGEILRWEHEALTLRLADKTGYTPDFMVVLKDGMVELHEVKGFMRDDAAVKLKVAADRYPKLRFRLVKRVRGEWVIRVIGGDPYSSDHASSSVRTGRSKKCD